MKEVVSKYKLFKRPNFKNLVREQFFLWGLDFLEISKKLISGSFFHNFHQLPTMYNMLSYPLWYQHQKVYSPCCPYTVSGIQQMHIKCSYKNAKKLLLNLEAFVS